MGTRRIAKEKLLRIRLTDHERTKLSSYAARHGWTASHVIREYIRRLPNPRVDVDTSA